jgi:hypothetical protein
MKERYRKEVTGKRRRRRKQLLDDPRKIKDSGNLKRKYQIAVLENSLWKAEYRTNEQTNEWMNERKHE